MENMSRGARLFPTYFTLLLIIEQKMKLVPTRNMAAYLRKIAIDGYIIQTDHSLATRLQVITQPQKHRTLYRHPNRGGKIKELP